MCLVPDVRVKGVHHPVTVPRRGRPQVGVTYYLLLDKYYLPPQEHDGAAGPADPRQGHGAEDPAGHRVPDGREDPRVQQHRRERCRVSGIIGFQ